MLSEVMSADVRQVSAFEDRYGAGSHPRLIARLRRPCVSFAEIAVEFGVTRERVRQWRQSWLPDAPTGRERRRLCRRRRQKQRLLSEPLFRSFYHHVRPHLSPGRLAFVPSRTGFRKRLVRVDGRAVFIKAARQYVPRPGSKFVAYALTMYRGAADFIYFKLGEADYLFMPTAVFPAAGTTFLDTPASKYQQFRNTVAALDVKFS